MMYGTEISNKIKLRLTVLNAAPNLAAVPKTKPERCHALKGKKTGQYAIDLKHPYRLIFRPDHDPLPKNEEGQLDLARITRIKIISVEDYH